MEDPVEFLKVNDVMKNANLRHVSRPTRIRAPRIDSYLAHCWAGTGWVVGKVVKGDSSSATKRVLADEVGCHVRYGDNCGVLTNGEVFVTLRMGHYVSWVDACGPQSRKVGAWFHCMSA